MSKVVSSDHHYLATSAQTAGPAIQKVANPAKNDNQWILEQTNSIVLGFCNFF
jgi:hypothetical protein